LCNLNGCDLLMPAKIQSAGNVLQNPQEAIIATYICFLTNFSKLELTNIQAKYWWGQMHCGPSNQNFGWAMAAQSTLQCPYCWWDVELFCCQFVTRFLFVFYSIDYLKILIVICHSKGHILNRLFVTICSIYFYFIMFLKLYLFWQWCCLRLQWLTVCCVLLFGKCRQVVVNSFIYSSELLSLFEITGLLRWVFWQV